MNSNFVHSLLFHLVHLFFHHHTWLSRLSFPPLLFLLLTWPLISCFLLSVLTQDRCALLCRCPLKNWQSTWLATDIKFYYTLFNPQAFLYSFSTRENDRQALWLFTFSESQYSVTSNYFWLATLYRGLTESLHMVHHCKLCDIWNMPRHVTINELCVNMGHPCLMSSVSWNVNTYVFYCIIYLNFFFHHLISNILCYFAFHELYILKLVHNIHFMCPWICSTLFP